MKKILMVVTNNQKLGDSDYKTGVYLNEFLEPYLMFSEHKWTIDIASPKGGVAPLDPNSVGDLHAEDQSHLLKNTIPFSAITADEYDAVFIVGGHGVMWDLPDNSSLHKIVSTIWMSGGIVAAVCHGSAALVNVRDSQGDFIIGKRRITGFSNEEEAIVGADKHVPFLVESRLVQSGALYEKAPAFNEHVVRDGQLITGQNPASAAALAACVSEVLKM